MTKHEEIEMFAKLVAGLPAGYVRDILTECKADVEWAINADFGFIGLSERLAQVMEHREAMAIARKELAAVKASIQQLEDKKQYLETGLYQIRMEVRKYANA